MLDKVIPEIEKKFGRANPDIVYDPKRKITITAGTGCKELDRVIREDGGGLLIEGRMTEIFGPESSGKTSIVTGKHVILLSL